MIDFTNTLPKSKLVAELLARVFKPKPDDFSRFAMSRRQYILNTYVKHDFLDSPSVVQWKQPFVDYLILLSSMEQFLACSLLAGLEDPFEFFKERNGLEDTALAFWAAGWKVPPIREALESFFLKELGEPYYFFRWINDGVLEARGLITSRRPSADWLRGDTTPRWFLTQRACSYPLAKHCKRRTQRVLDGGWIYKVDLDNVQELKATSLAFVRERWRFLQQLNRPDLVRSSNDRTDQYLIF